MGLELHQGRWVTAAYPTVRRCPTRCENRSVFHLVCTYANTLGHRVHFGLAKGGRRAGVPFPRTIPPRSEKLSQPPPNCAECSGTLSIA